MTMRRLPLVIEQAQARIRSSRTSLTEGLRSKVGRDNVTCRKGCAHCCSYPIYISLLEGILLYRGLRNAGLWRSKLEKALESHSNLTSGLAPEVWLTADIACPLLDENRLCLAYDDRPFLCRATLSVGNPDDCRGVRFSETSFVPRQEEAIEFRKVVSSLKDQYDSRLLHHATPISTAVLLGRLIMEETSEADDLDDVISTYLQKKGA